MKHVTAIFAIDSVGAALNNGEANRVKSMYHGGRKVPYVSAQSIKYWLRNTIEDTSGLQPSPVLRKGGKAGGDGKGAQAITSGNPALYYDDDIFGYMIASNDDAGSKRRATLSLSPAVGYGGNITREGFAAMMRPGTNEKGEIVTSSLPFDSEFANGLMVTQMSFALDRVGVFPYKGQRDREISPIAIQNMGAGVDDGSKVVMDAATRNQRITAALRGLVRLQGGAKQGLHYVDTRPAFFLAAVIDSAAAPFGRALVDGQLRPDAVDQALKMHKGEFLSPVHCGYLAGVPALDGAHETVAHLCQAHGVDCVIDDTYSAMDSLINYAQVQ